jgi:tetratricopeptide (TPR) repeat protein
MGRLAIFCGQYDVAERRLRAAERIFRKLDRQQPLCVVDAYRSLMWLHRGEPGKALVDAERSFVAAQERAASAFIVNRDFIRADLLIGWSCDELRLQMNAEETSSLDEVAAAKLRHALAACGRSEVLELRSAVLVCYARHLLRIGSIEEAVDAAERALKIADEHGYGLHKVNAHCALAEIAHSKEDSERQRIHAEAAKRGAFSRKEGFRFRWGFDTAMRLGG